ncbi:protein spaetzle-like [Anabrus simplex]|uniref:protein spaetzle-like n=1 Tax=Anabrus simplex TaxID=316456 RepID=UPI0035A373CA
MGSDDGNPLCRAREMTIFPKMAQNKDNDWLFIVNVEPEYIQGVHVEVCENENAPCELSQAFPPGYTSFCRQKFIYRKLIALNGDGKPVPDSFKLPSCCACYSVRTPVGSRSLSANKSSKSRPQG